MELPEVEEGEISDGSDCEIDLYTPLRRPIDLRDTNHTINLPVAPESDDDDSDSDSGIPCGKRLRMSAPSSQIPKKYCVWTSNANDDITDILTSFGMDTLDTDRSVESYPIPMTHRLKKEAEEQEAKDLQSRRRKVPAGKRFNPLAPIPIPKELDDIDVTSLNTIEEVAKQIAEKLDEPNFDLLMRIVLILGKTSAMDYFKKTREIESKGGLLILNGSRRRTSGGVFIHLIRTDKQIPGSKLVEIFEDPNLLNAQKQLSKLRKRRKNKKIQKELSNPPPSPEISSEHLPELPERRELISYKEMDLADFS